MHLKVTEDSSAGLGNEDRELPYGKSLTSERRAKRPTHRYQTHGSFSRRDSGKARGWTSNYRLVRGIARCMGEPGLEL